MDRRPVRRREGGGIADGKPGHKTPERLDATRDAADKVDMTYDRFEAAALALPGATFEIKWETNRTFCVGGRIFAFGGHLGEERPRVCLKVSEASFEQLVEEGVAEPAPYLARAKWVRFQADGVSDDELVEYLRRSHALVAAKLTRRERAAIGVG